VPFQGTGAAIPAVISNQVGAMWGFMAGLIPHIRSGALKALMTNPLVGDVDRAVPLLDELLDANRAHLPRFYPG